MGMSYQEYWYDDPELFFAYANRHKVREERKTQEQDAVAWLVGQYVLQAVAVNFAHAFGKPGSSKPKYPEIPMYVAEHNEQAKAKKKERDLMRSYNNFIAAAQQMGKLKN